MAKDTSLIDAFALGQLLDYLLGKVTANPVLQKRILAAFRDQVFRLHTLHALVWQDQHPDDDVADFLTSGQCPPFAPPDLAHGKKTDDSSLIRAMRTYERVLRELKRQVRGKVHYRTNGDLKLEGRKHDIEAALTTGLSPKERQRFTAKDVQRWVLLPREDIAGEIAALLHGESPAYFRRSLPKMRARYPLDRFSEQTVDDITALLSFLGVLPAKDAKVIHRARQKTSQSRR
jgi:hypothetical protein